MRLKNYLARIVSVVIVIVLFVHVVLVTHTIIHLTVENIGCSHYSDVIFEHTIAIQNIHFAIKIPYWTLLAYSIVSFFLLLTVIWLYRIFTSENRFHLKKKFAAIAARDAELNKKSISQHLLAYYQNCITLIGYLHAAEMYEYSYIVSETPVSKPSTLHSNNNFGFRLMTEKLSVLFSLQGKKVKSIIEISILVSNMIEFKCLTSEKSFHKTLTVNASTIDLACSKQLQALNELSAIVLKRFQKEHLIHIQATPEHSAFVSDEFRSCAHQKEEPIPKLTPSDWEDK